MLLPRYYGCIKLIDIFQFSNTYTVNQNIKLLPRDLSLQSECVKFVSRYGVWGVLRLRLNCLLIQEEQNNRAFHSRLSSHCTAHFALVYL